MGDSSWWGIVVGCVALAIAALLVGWHYGIEHRRKRLLRQLDHVHHHHLRDWLRHHRH